MTPEELSKLEDLDRTAMPGPWRLTTQMGIPGEGTVYGIRCGVGYQVAGFNQADAEMLVVMRNALPGLLREIREQAATIKWLESKADCEYPCSEERRCSRAQLCSLYKLQQAEIDRLKAALDLFKEAGK